MLVSHRHRLGFIHIPKAAGTSIDRWLLEGSHGFQRPWGQGVHDPLCRLLLPELRQYQWFAVHRDPWDRLWSDYLHKLRTHYHDDFRSGPRGAGGLALGFDHYCRTWWNRWPQQLWVDHRTHMLSFRNLREDFAWVQQRLRDTRPLPHLNSNPSPRPTAYGSELVDWLRPQLRPDCVRWGYRDTPVA